MLDNYYMFVVDTDRYAGNFERQMCAYITGHIGDCGVGGEEKKLFEDEEGNYLYELLWTNNTYIVNIADERGCYRPCIIKPNPRHSNKFPAYLSVAIFFSEPPTEEIVSFLKRRAEKFCAEYWHNKSKLNEKVTIEGYRLLQFKTTIEEIWYNTK